VSRILVSISTQSAAVHLAVTADWRVLGFALAAATLTCAIFGVLPALRATSAQPVTAMKTGGSGMTASRECFSLQRFMVVTQVAVSLVLVLTALLFVRSFRNLILFDPGMDEGGITIAFAGFQDSNVPPDQWAEFQTAVAGRRCRHSGNRRSGHNNDNSFAGFRMGP
jgi:hypothetical protein